MEKIKRKKTQQAIRRLRIIVESETFFLLQV